MLTKYVMICMIVVMLISGVFAAVQYEEPTVISHYVLLAGDTCPGDGGTCNGTETCQYPHCPYQSTS